MAQKALSALKNLWAKLPIKAPWKYTGVASSVEFQSHLPVASEYRMNAPGSQPVRAMVPAAEPNLVYNIKYYDRDTRRASQVINGAGKTVLKTYTVDLSKPDEELEAMRAAGKPPVPGIPYKWGKPTALGDYENNGYTFTPPEPPAPNPGARQQNWTPP